MSTLRRQMMQDLELGGYAETTRDHYLRAIAQFARFHGRSPAELHQPEVRLWVQHLMGQGLSTQRLRQDAGPSGGDGVPVLAAGRGQAAGSAERGASS